MKQINMVNATILGMEPGDEPIPITTISDLREEPSLTVRSFHFRCNGRRCSLSYFENDTTYKLRNFFPKISVHLKEEGRWLDYDDPEDWDMRETIYYSDLEKPNPILLALLQDRVEHLLARDHGHSQRAGRRGELS